jgi:hypothetical protein
MASEAGEGEKEEAWQDEMREVGRACFFLGLGLTVFFDELEMSIEQGFPSI